MLLKPYALGCLPHTSALIADEATGTPLVVNPRRNLDPSLHDATQPNLHLYTSRRRVPSRGLQNRNLGSAGL